VEGKPRPVTLESGFDWGPGKLAPKAFTLRPGPAVEVPDAGDFEKDQSFSCGLWVKIPKRGQGGALVARMDNGNGYRGWDVWMEADRVGMHIVHRWDDDGIKVVSKTPLQPGRWYHVLVTYDGSGKAAGVKIYLDGVVQPADVANDKLKQTIRT